MPSYITLLWFYGAISLFRWILPLSEVYLIAILSPRLSSWVLGIAGLNQCSSLVCSLASEFSLKIHKELINFIMPCLISVTRASLISSVFPQMMVHVWFQKGTQILVVSDSHSQDRWKKNAKKKHVFFCDFLKINITHVPFR